MKFRKINGNPQSLGALTCFYVPLEGPRGGIYEVSFGGKIDYLLEKKGHPLIRRAFQKNLRFKEEYSYLIYTFLSKKEDEILSFPGDVNISDEIYQVKGDYMEEIIKLSLDLSGTVRRHLETYFHLTQNNEGVKLDTLEYYSHELKINPRAREAKLN